MGVWHKAKSRQLAAGSIDNWIDFYSSRGTEHELAAHLDLIDSIEGLVWEE